MHKVHTVISSVNLTLTFIATESRFLTDTGQTYMHHLWRNNQNGNGNKNKTIKATKINKDIRNDHTISPTHILTQ